MNLSIRSSLGALVIAASVSADLHAQTWARVLDDGLRASMRNVIPLDQGGYLACGFSSILEAYEPQGLLLRLDREGNVAAWWRTDVPERVYFMDMVQRREYAVVVGSFDGRPWLAEFDPMTGQRMFQFKLSEEEGSINEICRTADGGFVVVGQVETENDGIDVLVAKLDRFLLVRWIQRFGGANDDTGASATGTSDGGCIVSAFSSTFGRNNRDLWMLSLDATGAVRWNRTYSFPDDPVVTYSTVVELSDGTVVVGWDAARLMALDASGNVQWQRQVDLESRCTLESMQAAADGGFLVGGYAYETEEDGWIAKFDASGLFEWQRAYDLNGDEDVYLYGMTESLDGAIVAIGERSGEGRDTTAVLRTDAKGRIHENCPIEWDTAFVPFDLAAVVDEQAPHVHPVNISSGTAIDLSDREVDAVTLCANLADFTFQPFGAGTSGSGGFVPAISGIDGWAAADDARLEIGGGLGGAPLMVMVGVGQDTTAFAGGSLYVDFASVFTFLELRLTGSAGSPGDGSLSLPVRGRFDDHIGLDLYAQAIVLDPAGTDGVALSNGISIEIR